MNPPTPLFSYILRQADNVLILGQRLSEWCGHGPILEQDIALTNFALDLIGQARSLYQYAAEVEGKGRSEDDLAYLRDGFDFYNVLLVELPKGDFGHTMTRQFFFDAYNYYFYQQLQKSSDPTLAAIAEKSIKEVTYHLRYSSEWMIRLGDGTEESHRRMQTAVDALWAYTGELYTPDAIDQELLAAGIAVDLGRLQQHWQQRVREILTAATLDIPTETWMQKGGKQGRHTEHLGYVLAEMQYLQRTYPNSEW
ncbi:MAG: 1,2-phenylacetyl-CoA epoxidase subunit PaaC [Bacteroidota bacterium]